MLSGERVRPRTRSQSKHPYPKRKVFMKRMPTVLLMMEVLFANCESARNAITIGRPPFRVASE